MNWLEANGAALRYELRGDGRGLIALIHEMGGTLESWDDVAPALAAKRRTLRFDMRGSGHSEKTSGTLSIDTLADDLAAMLDRLGVNQPIAVAGCAVGGAVAIHFAARHAERVAGLVAMAPATFLPPERKGFAHERADALDRDGTRASFPPPPQPTPPVDDPKARLRARRIANDPHGVAALWRMLAGLDLNEDYKRIRCPTLVLAGRLDESRPPALVEEHVARKLPHARYQALDTGHVMPVDTPELITKILSDFLDEISL